MTLLLKYLELVGWLGSGIAIMVCCDPIPVFCYACAIFGVAVHIVADIAVETKRRKNP